MDCRSNRALLDEAAIRRRLLATCFLLNGTHRHWTSTRSLEQKGGDQSKQPAATGGPEYVLYPTIAEMAAPQQYG